MPSHSTIRLSTNECVYVHLWKKLKSFLFSSILVVQNYLLTSQEHLWIVRRAFKGYPFWEAISGMRFLLFALPTQVFCRLSPVCHFFPEVNSAHPFKSFCLFRLSWVMKTQLLWPTPGFHRICAETLFFPLLTEKKAITLEIRGSMAFYFPNLHPRVTVITHSVVT